MHALVSQMSTADCRIRPLAPGRDDDGILLDLRHGVLHQRHHTLTVASESQGAASQDIRTSVMQLPRINTSS